MHAQFCKISKEARQPTLHTEKQRNVHVSDEEINVYTMNTGGIDSGHFTFFLQKYMKLLRGNLTAQIICGSM